jgi:hypothetical protein
MEAVVASGCKEHGDSFVVDFAARCWMQPESVGGFLEFLGRIRWG